jgi:thiol-disulfide isomerase/thioredoxin
MNSRSIRLAATALLVLIATTACTQTVPSVTTTDGYAAVSEFPNPGKPVTFSGTTVQGKPLNSKTYLGHVVVVNFWYAGCSPCVAETPALTALAKKEAVSGVDFIGVNVRDSAANAEYFYSLHAPAYPSILDAQTGSAQLAFNKSHPPDAIPSTLVLDAEGRVRSRIVGALPATSILTALIDSARAGRS